MKAILYKCDHYLYDACTLFTNGEKGIAVIQQRFNKRSKIYWWSSVDAELISDILANPYLEQYVENYGDKPNENGLYVTVELRKLMWALHMKRPQKEIWETHF